jgi:hypothetical protein
LVGGVAIESFLIIAFLLIGPINDVTSGIPALKFVLCAVKRVDNLILFEIINNVI